MKEIKIIIHSQEQMINLGTLIGNLSYPNLVIGLNGDLGAGKTVLAKGIGLALGVSRVINSPTFTIMKIYETKNDKIKKLYHLDVYRLTDAESDFELEEYFYLDGLTVIEWSKIIDDILPNDMWHVDIQIASETTRIVTIKYANCDLEERIKEADYEIIY